MKRNLLALAATAALFGSPVVAQSGMTAEETTLYEAAKQEGELTWYVAQFTTAVAEDFAAEFTSLYPGVSVNVIRATGQVIFSRLAQDNMAGVAQADVFSGSDQAGLVELKGQDQLMAYVSPNASLLRKPYLMMEADGYWQTTSANPTVMVYNTEQVSAAEAPTNWTDLLDPKWKGKIAVAHPGFSGSMGSWSVMIDNLYGRDFFVKLEENDPLIGRSLSDPPTVVTAGERAIGLSTLGTATRLKGKGNPIEIIYPTDGAKLTLSGTAIPANAPHPNAAKLFVNYLHSVPGSATMTKHGLQPLRTEVPPPAGAKALDEFALYNVSLDDLVNKIQPMIEQWRDIFGG